MSFCGYAADFTSGRSATSPAAPSSRTCRASADSAWSATDPSTSNGVGDSKISLSLHNVSTEQALNLVCTAANLRYSYRDGSYDPTGPVLHAQAVSFVTRAMIRKGYWTLQEDNAAYYTALPTASGHRQDAVTYHFYAGNILGTAAPTDPWNGPTGYDQPSTRTYFAQVLWQAYSSYFSVNHIP